ncbi:related to bacterial aminoglycoside acetyltransferase regulators [Cephalotrichum gorgonifer]|uniref:Related to bacterial aminoglycoside acetyltransferase regulators n=1 Tax=Cephalotrichum gorgonifer TaxID=2041049 RepID=A0AAE8MU86_9PEZI|nr:related to bacterial aminoglycoside acetyltransferase regulators [Cephalotrichum gorgonifer]
MLRLIASRGSPGSLRSGLPRLPRFAIERPNHHDPLLPGLPTIRSRMQSSSYEAFRPPSPESLGRPAPPRTYPRSQKWLRRLAILSATFGTVYLVDRHLYASSLARSLLTFRTGLIVALDYKINFRPQPLTGGTLQDVHVRNAERMFNLLSSNGGLYLKMGQAIAMQSAVLPPEFQKMFARMFDDAPQDEWKDVEAVLREDFGGKGPEEVFGVSFTGEKGKGIMERKARASASVAQVHWARLADGREVAIKIQKREIARQIAADLWAFKTVARIFSWWFDLPFYSMIPFVAERLELETDFENEAKNSETMRQLVNSEPSMRGRVYIPTVYSEFTTRRVLVTEWIEGVRLWDKEGLTSMWLGGHGNGSPGLGNELRGPDMSYVRKELQQHPMSEDLKPSRLEWKGPRGKGGLGLQAKDVMSTMVDLFSAQIFKWGVIHCDPHPGNIFVRRLPSGRAELVLIDHGLYVYLKPEFRHQYSRFWKSLMTLDTKAIGEITEQWGIRGPEMFASATLMRPYEGEETKKFLRELDGKTPAEKHYAMQQKMKATMREFLADEEKWPKELIFIGRNMRIVQGNNQYLGSPVNRIRTMGEWASKGLYTDPNLPLGQRLVNAWRHLIFKAVLAATDLAFYFFKIRQTVGWGGGMEDEVEKRMKAMVGDLGGDLGVEMEGDVFAG